MKFIQDAKSILLRSYSMWSMYFGLVCLVLPNVLFGVWGIETDPYPIGWAALVFFVAGIVGRLIDQKQSGFIARMVFLGSFGFGAAMFGLSLGGAVVDDFYQPQETSTDAALQLQGAPVDVYLAMAEAPQVARVASGVASTAEFLEVAVPYVGKWEGLRLKAYRDIVGVLTVCYGETKGVRAGDSYTKAECDAMLARELISYRAGLHRYLSPETLASRLPVHRDTAFVSLAYNVGIAGAGRSTAVKRLNAGNIAGACHAITWWNKAGQRVVRGLTLRRGEDYGKCMIGVVA